MSEEVDWSFLEDNRLRGVVKRALSYVKKLIEEGKPWRDFELHNIQANWWDVRKLANDYRVFKVSYKSRSHTCYTFAVPIEEIERRLREYEMARRREIDAVVVAYRDRLTRFGFEYIKVLFNILGVELFVAFQEESKDYLQELVEDFMEITASFAARIYGKRSHKYKKVVSCVKEVVEES